MAVRTSTRFDQSLQRTCQTLAIVLVLLSAADAGPPDSGGAVEADGALLDRIDRRNHTLESFLRLEVSNTLNRARGLMGSQPEQAEKMLALLDDKVSRATETGPELRAQLVQQIDAALRSARRQVQLRTEHEQSALQTAAEVHAGHNTEAEHVRQQRSAAHLVSQFNALMAEKRYRDAEMLASVTEESNPGNPVFRNAILQARMAGNTADMNTLRTMREKGVVDVWHAEHLASIPIPDQPPVLFPDPETWQLLRERRQKYAGLDLAQSGSNEAKIRAALDEKTEFDFLDQPLSDVVDYLKQRHGIEIQLDTRPLAEAGVDIRMPVTRAVKGVSLRSALQLLLRDLDLTFVIRYEVLLITSKAEAETMTSARVYPVADLISTNPFVRRAARRVNSRLPGGTVGNGVY